MLYEVIDRETITGLTAAKGFTAANLPPTKAAVIYAIIQAIDAAIRFCIDGTTPTSSKGMRLTKDDSVEIWGSKALADFLAIDDGGTAEVEVIFMGRGS